jgi:putative DNA primase/helicase
MTDLNRAAALLGGEVSGRQILAPGPGHSPSDRSLAVRFSDCDFIVHSFAGQDFRECRDHVKRLLGIYGGYAPACIRPSPQPETGEDIASRIDRALGYWNASTSLAGTLGWRYLTERRQLAIGTLRLDHCLRWHSGLGDYGAVVALMTDPVTSEPCGIHRTFLRPDATNVIGEDGKKKKWTLGRWGVIRLSPDEEVTQGLGIAEGLETTSRVMLCGWSPMWCAVSAYGIAKFPVLSGLESLTIFLDDDENKAGEREAEKCARRWTAAECEVRLAHPKDSYT